MGGQTPDWISDARATLLRLFIPGRGWDYAGEQVPRSEPTALACLALRASQPGARQHPAAIYTGLRWLASIQQPSGAIGLSEMLPEPGWPTAYAILAWAGEDQHRSNAIQAAKWLLGVRGFTYRDQTGIFGHDTSIAGWPWNVGTHSWIEPTAMAVLALRRLGFADHGRTREGLRLIRDRAISVGGWNYGNNTVYGTVLRPQPGATGLALTALGGACAEDDTISRACAYLEQSVERLRAPQSLCWALLGLQAWNRRPPAAGEWLEQAYERLLHRGPQAPQLSYLLLAAREQMVFDLKSDMR